jgi:hypothetical protein
MQEYVTVGDILLDILGPDWNARPEFLSWPPDAFAICGLLLVESSAYVEVVKRWPPGRGGLAAWVKRTQRTGRIWRRNSLRGSQAPARIISWWKQVQAASQVPVSKINTNRVLMEALVELTAAADEACEGAGVPSETEARFAVQDVELKKEKDAFKERIRFLVLRRRTLCKYVKASRLTVLPKMRTPDNGITLRSLTHHLALVRPTGVQPDWLEAVLPEFGSHGISLLLVPWPERMLPIQFYPVAKPYGPRNREAPELPREHGFFAYEPGKISVGSIEQVAAKVGQLCDAAKRTIGRVDGIVFPEMALQPQEFDAIECIIRARDARLLVSGIYEPPANGRPARNYAKIVTRLPGSKWFAAEQHKHHRWFLDERQIKQYGLGAQLPTSMKWWEYTSLESRTLQFLALQPWLALTVLICEDLARPDPAAEIIRSVGPNLVIALLQDGPQLASRWPARSATVLADDPGCSVLTLTSTGMANLSRPPAGRTPSRSIAMWREKGQDAIEIELPSDADAVVLCLTNRYEKQWTADGRQDNQSTGCVGLAGIHPVRIGGK